jgi:hypothetical protein
MILQLNIVEDIEPAPRPHRNWRQFAKPALAVSLIALSCLYVYGLISITPHLIVRDPDLYLSPARLARRTRNLCILLTLLYVAVNLLSVPKQPVLFLRRFGLDVNLVVSRAIKAGLGRRFRFMTLDDSRFPLVGIPLIERQLALLALPVLAATTLAASFLLLRTLSKVTDIGDNLTIEVSGMVGYWSGIFWVADLLAFSHLYRMRRRSRMKVRKKGQLDNLLYRVRSIGSWWLRPSFLAPQLTLCSVADHLWKDAVSTAASVSAVVLVDISDPTENLRWEIEHLRGADTSCVFIAERQRLESWHIASFQHNFHCPYRDLN